MRASPAKNALGPGGGGVDPSRPSYTAIAILRDAGESHQRFDTIQTQLRAQRVTHIALLIGTQLQQLTPHAHGFATDPVVLEQRHRLRKECVHARWLGFTPVDVRMRIVATVFRAPAAKLAWASRAFKPCTAGNPPADTSSSAPLQRWTSLSVQFDAGVRQAAQSWQAPLAN